MNIIWLKKIEPCARLPWLFILKTTPLFLVEGLDDVKEDYMPKSKYELNEVV
jgi:hypothetical protein